MIAVRSASVWKNSATSEVKMRYLLFVLPLALLAALVAIFATSMDRDTDLIRSVLIDKPAPDFTMAALEGSGVPGFSTETLKGEVTLVNVFASWCIPCRDEHPLLEQISDVTGIRIFGINQADVPDNALAFLTELGNPYAAIGVDANRRVSIDWGVYGVPETFLVDAEGTIVFKHTGPLSVEAISKNLIPAIETARS
ncbi:DsbE family thiol:disulfide interchange protein [Devosia sp. MC521]|nr:DsbE family thiol:disulfide interchange protein [Devosia sp. MC521]